MMLMNTVFLDFRSKRMTNIKTLKNSIGQNAKPKKESHTNLSGETNGHIMQKIIASSPTNASTPAKKISMRLPNGRFFFPPFLLGFIISYFLLCLNKNSFSSFVRLS